MLSKQQPTDAQELDAMQWDLLTQFSWTVFTFLDTQDSQIAA
jgi:hypothetical protein